MNFDRNLNQLFLDCDGVLADFDKRAYPMFGMPPEHFEEKHGTREFWKTLNRDKLFFRNLDLMDDAMILYDTVKHLNPTILTGIPNGMNPDSNQKTEWGAEKFGPHQKIICCPAKKKREHAKPGDVLVDDRTVYKHLWEEIGGIYIVHQNALDTIDQLVELGVLLK